MAIKIALAGNPNCGKTTMFNDLTGSNQFVGNWPGVTVEKKEGKLKGHKDVIITDLPGIYSLSPYTLEEVVTRNYLIQEKPDVILRAAHGLPDMAREMFAKEFETNDIWKHFEAVQEGRVYDLDSSLFNMSANFNYAQALEQLQPMLYGDE